MSNQMSNYVQDVCHSARVPESLHSIKYIDITTGKLYLTVVFDGPISLKISVRLFMIAFVQYLLKVTVTENALQTDKSSFQY